MANFVRQLKQLGRKIVESGSIVDDLKKRAGEKKRKIVLCEGEDQRVVEAALRCTEDEVANIVLLGNAEQIAKENPDIDLSAVEIIDPAASEKRAEYAALLYQLRQAKGMTQEEAEMLQQ